MGRQEELKSLCQRDLHTYREKLVDLSLRLHSNPELSMEEEKAVHWLSEFLRDNGFRTDIGAYNIPTAFEAVYGDGTPHIGIIAEYDALPGIGHACGHNIIATSALGAGVALKRVVDALGGTISVIGTPGEEGRGGKILMQQNGAFANLDAAMMIHPGSYNMAGCIAMAVAILEVGFYGKASHAAGAPQHGINALEAMIISYNAINSLRQHVNDGSRVHGIITDGGQAPNVVPSHSAGTFYIRSTTDGYLETLKEKVIACFQSGALATGARLEYDWTAPQYRTMNNNDVMSNLFAKNLESLGRVVDTYENKNFGSTDMGNVSYLLPSIHPIIAVSPPTVPIHTEEFETYAKSDAGHKAMVDGATAMAWTVVDLLSDSSLLNDASQAFKHRTDP